MPRVSGLGVGGGLNHLCEVEVPEMFDRGGRQRGMMTLICLVHEEEWKAES